MFRGSLAENIRIGRPTATDEQVIEAAKHANAHDFIMEFPNGYDSEVGERGDGLSGGQKQRVALIGALLLNRSLYLLDEPTSAMDAPSREAVVEFFGACDATLLWISHEAHPLMPPDQVVTVSPGEAPG